MRLPGLLAIAVCLLPAASAGAAPTVLGSVPITTSAPHQVAVNPNTNRVYVGGSYAQGPMAVVDVSNPASPTVVTTHPGISGAVVNPATNRYYGSTGYSGTVRVFDGTTDAQVGADIPIGFCGGDFDVDAANNKIFMLSECGGGDAFDVIDGATSTHEAGPLPAGGVNEYVLFNPATGRTYDNNYRFTGNDRFVRVRGPGPGYAFITDLTGFVKALNPVTNRLYQEAGADLNVLDGNTHAVIGTIVGGNGDACGGWYFGVDTSTNTVYAPDCTSGVIKIIDGATNTVTTTISLGGTFKPYGVLAVDSSAHRLYIVGVDASNNQRLFVVGNPPTPTADLALTKTSSPTTVNSGSNFTYSLSVKNNGPDNVTGATVTDPLPPGVTFVSAGPGCSHSAGTITCTFNFIGSGGTVVKNFIVKATASPPKGKHLLTVSKVEQQVDLNAGQTRTVLLSCATPGAIMTDGSGRVDAVDQGTGTLASVDFLEARSTASGTYQFTLRNNATGRAQTKVFGTCLSGTTTDGSGHTHSVQVSAPHTATHSGGPGSVGGTLSCGPGEAAISPGFNFTAGVGTPQQFTPSVDLASWTFGFNTAAPATVQVSVRCLDTFLAVAAGHTHELRLSEEARTVSLPANSVTTARVTCADDAKGIVASYDLPAGVRMLGHEPQPKIRDFRLLNTTGSAQSATLDLLCLRDRTTAGRVRVTNTATVSWAGGVDPNPANDTSSVTTVIKPA